MAFRNLTLSLTKGLLLHDPIDFSTNTWLLLLDVESRLTEAEIHLEDLIFSLAIFAKAEILQSISVADSKVHILAILAAVKVP